MKILDFADRFKGRRGAIYGRNPVRGACVGSGFSLAESQLTNKY